MEERYINSYYVGWLKQTWMLGRVVMNRGPKMEGYCFHVKLVHFPGGGGYGDI